MTVDPEAPYGRHADGTPKRSNGGRPKGTTRNRRAGTAPKAATPKRKPAPASTGPAKQGPRDYTDALTEVAKMAAMALVPTAPLDAAVVLNNAGDLAEAVNELAQVNAKVRAACERFAVIGPYGKLWTIVQRIGAQIAENHGWLPPQITQGLGAVPRDHFAHQFQQMVDQQIYEQQFAEDSGAPYPPESAPVDLDDNVAPFQRRDTVHA